MIEVALDTPLMTHLASSNAFSLVYSVSVVRSTAATVSVHMTEHGLYYVHS